MEYVAALRLLTGTYAFCGTHAVPRKLHPGTMTLMMTWEAALGYADTVTEKLIKVDLPEHAKLQWVRARDEQTRADMAQMVCEEWPAHEALEKAMDKQAHYWRMLDNLVAAPPPPELRAEEPRGGKRAYDGAPWNGPGNGKGKGGGKRQKGGAKGKDDEVCTHRIITVDKHRVKYCGAFNSKRGCVKDERRCPQKARHACAVEVGRGTVCGARDHGAAGH